MTGTSNKSFSITGIGNASLFEVVFVKASVNLIRFVGVFVCVFLGIVIYV